MTFVYKICQAGVGIGTGIPPGSQSRDRFLDPGLGPGSTSENRDPGFFRLNLIYFLDFEITFENLIFLLYEKAL